MLRRLRTRVTYLPRPVKAVIKRLARTRAMAAPAAAAGCAVDPFASAKTRAAFVNNNRCGGIRLNLRGREPFGSVEPGPEAAALLQMLRRELLALRDPASGEAIITRVQTSTEAFGPDHHPDLPDLICVFRTDLGMLERCESPAVGLVHAPVYHPHAPRSGDHTVNSQLWVSGPEIVGTREKSDSSWRAILTTEDPLFAPDPRPPMIDAAVPMIRFERPGAVILKRT